MFDDFERVQLEMNICNKTQINVSNETRLVVCEGVSMYPNFLLRRVYVA